MDMPFLIGSRHPLLVSHVVSMLLVVSMLVSMLVSLYLGTTALVRVLHVSIHSNSTVPVLATSTSTRYQQSTSNSEFQVPYSCTINGSILEYQLLEYQSQYVPWWCQYCTVYVLALYILVAVSLAVQQYTGTMHLVVLALVEATTVVVLVPVHCSVRYYTPYLGIQYQYCYHS